MFRPHKGVCLCHNKPNIIVVRAGFCKQGNEEQKRLKKGLSAKPKAISFMSGKRKIKNKQYLKVREEYLLEHPKCEANIKGVCSKKPANQIHHKKGRIGKLLTDKRYFLSTEDNCHDWIETHPKEAKELGFSLLRTSK